MKSRYTALVSASVLVLAGCAENPVSGEPLALTRHGGIAFNSAAAEAGDTYLVRFKSNGVPSDFASAVAALGGEVIFAHSGVGVAAVAGISEASAASLAARKEIAAVDPDAYVEMDAPTDITAEAANDAVESPSQPNLAFFYPRQWHMRAISADLAWAAGRVGKSSTTVGILDTGIDYTRPDLQGRVDLTNSRSFLSAAENARVQTNFPGAHEIADLHYHGTHVAATVSSNGLTGAGVTSGVTLIGMKVCAPGTATNGWRGSCPTSGTLAAILYAADLGVDVINMSLGGRFNRRDASAAGGFGPSFLATINQIFNYANRKGTTIVVSAGNDNIDMDHDGNGYKSYCSTAAVICVSATAPSAPAPTNGPWVNVDAKASYSNYGRSSVTVAAPGGASGRSVWAACSGFSLAIPVCQTGNFIVGISGTSMAAPHATGVAALIVGEIGDNPAQVTARLLQTADDLGQPGTDPIYGKGRINAARAVGVN